MVTTPNEQTLDSLVAVLDAIRLHGANSRSDLEARTGLGRTIVAERVRELIEVGLVRDGDPGRSTGGRPARQLAFNADAGHVLVADLGATSIDVALTTLGGEIIAHRDEPADIAEGPEQCLARVDELFAELLGSTRAVPGGLWGVGIGVPGPVEFRTGTPISPPIMPGWDGYPVGSRFARAYGAPVWVDNDVNLLVLGEWRSGAAVGHENVVMVKIGTGIGAGIISDGRLHRGAQGSAGDIGHIQIVDELSVVCRCGNIGCLEAVAGGAALARDGEAAAREGRSDQLRVALEQHGRVSAEDVARAASHGDAVCVALVQSAGRRIGRTLASIVNFFNPSLIVVGGGLSQTGDQMLAAIREAVYRRSLPLATRELLIQRSSLGGRAGVIGASAMVVDQLFARDYIGRWMAAGGPPAIARAS
jgi:glucokinase-like ROK family protein